MMKIIFSLAGVTSADHEWLSSLVARHYRTAGDEGIIFDVPCGGENVAVTVGVTGDPSRTKRVAVSIEPLRELARPSSTYMM